METGLVVQSEVLDLTLLNIDQMQIENVNEPWPEDVYGELLKERIQDQDSVDSLHLLLALLINLYHDQY